jgi:DNA primase
MQFYFDKYLTPEVLADINKKKPAVATVLKELNKIANSIEKDHWLKELSNRIDVSEVILREAMPSTSKEMKTHTPYPITHNSPEPSVEQKEKQKPRSQEYSERILTILLNHPEFIGYAQEYFLPEFIYNEKLKDLYKKVILWYNSAEEKSSREQLNSLLNSNINSEDGGYIDSLFLYVDKIYENFDQPELQEELVKLIETYKINFLGQKVNHLNSQLATAEQQGNKQEVDRLIKEIQILSENLAKLK